MGRKSADNIQLLLYWLAFLFLFVVSTPVFASSDKIRFYQLSSSDVQVSSISHLVTYEDNIWQPVSQDNVNLVDGTNWLAVDVDHALYDIDSLYLKFGKSINIHGIEVYARRSESQLVAIPLIHLNIALAAKLMPNKPLLHRYYIKVESRHVIAFDVDILTPEHFAKETSKAQFNAGIAIGGLASFAVILFLLFVANKDRFVMILSGYFATQSILLAVILGNNLYFFLPELPELQGVEYAFLVPLSSLFFMWFCSGLFRLKIVHDGLHKAFKIVAAAILVYLPLSFLFNTEQNYYIAQFIALLVVALLLTFALLLLKQKQRLALMFTIVVSVQLVFILIDAFNNVWFSLPPYAYMAAYWINAFMVSFVLSRQYYYQIKDKHIAQRQAIENEMISRQAQEELIRVQNENQEELEMRVQERTLELNIALQELEEANRELEAKNTIDDLTGLYNRRFYDQKILAEHRRSRRNLTPLSIVVIDIDHFKKVNDTYGHLAGDYCLAELAELIKKVLRRSTDIGCRYGGEEFCLILPETNQVGAAAIAEELRVVVEQYQFSYEEQLIAVTISCGVSTYQQQQDWLPTHIFEAADKALYQAKHNGRNCVELAEPEIADESN